MTNYDITETMIMFGGSFASLLAQLFRAADLHNQRRIMEAFPDYFDQYTKLTAERHKQEGRTA